MLSLKEAKAALAKAREQLDTSARFSAAAVVVAVIALAVALVALARASRG